MLNPSELNGKTFHRSDLAENLRQHMYEIERQSFEQKKQILDEMILTEHVDQIARVKKQTREATLAKLF